MPEISLKEKQMKNKIIKIFTFILILSAPVKLFAQNIEIKAGANSQIVHTDKDYYIPFIIVIPNKKYIYGNPKGPGVGKTTSIIVKTANNKLITEIQIEKPEKYYPAGELKWVWRYINQATFYVPLKKSQFNSSKTFSLNIKVDALMCDYQSCYPVIKNFSYTINESILKNLPQTKNKKLLNTILLGQAHQAHIEEKDVNHKKNIQQFSPRYLKNELKSSIVLAIIFSIIAGFLLNFMPCVLPVISIKLLSIINYANNQSKKIIASGLLFTLGMLLSFIILASLAAFAGQSWGSLFQNNTFLTIMILILFLLALSLIGVYTLNIPLIGLKTASKNYSNLYLDSFMKGFFTTFLATPCSGPFLGSTLTWALTQPVYIIYIIFISIGIGMSLPYLVLSFKPGLIKFIPKPGNWMIYFEKIMGFFLLGTVIYLLGILPEKIIIKTIWMLFIISIALWQYGLWGNKQQAIRKRIISLLLLILLITAGYYIFLARSNSVQRDLFLKQSFSMQKLLEEKNQNKISIVEFTADWCPNCKIVEANAINSNDFKTLVKTNNLAFFIADITRPGTEGEALLKKLGGRSIPFLAIFGTGSSFSTPICLYDLYTYKKIKNAIKLIKKESLTKDPLKIPRLKIETIEFK